MRLPFRARVAALASLALLSGAGRTEYHGPVAAPPKPVCGRSHADAVAALSAPRIVLLDDALYDQEAAREAATPDARESPGSLKSRGVRPRSELPALMRSGLYADPFYENLRPYFAMGTDNLEGDWNTGLCWWHSRFHRAAAYLVDFAPAAPKPTPEEAERLFRRLTDFQPVTLPGYATLGEFTFAYEGELESALSGWQRRTTFFSPGYVVGAWLSKTFQTRATREKMTKRALGNLLDDLDVVPRPIFLMLEVEGGIHSFLALGYRPEGPESVAVTVMDSSNATRGPWEWRPYVNGELDLRVPGRASSILLFHTQFDEDFEAIQDGLRAKCGANYRIPRR